MRNNRQSLSKNKNDLCNNINEEIENSTIHKQNKKRKEKLLSMRKSLNEEGLIKEQNLLFNRGGDVKSNLETQSDLRKERNNLLFSNEID